MTLRQDDRITPGSRQQGQRGGRGGEPINALSKSLPGATTASTRGWARRRKQSSALQSSQSEGRDSALSSRRP